MIIKKAFTIAWTGKPGVAAVDLPKDIQKEYGSDEYPVQRSPYSPEKIIREIFDLIRTKEKVKEYPCYGIASRKCVIFSSNVTQYYGFKLFLKI